MCRETLLSIIVVIFVFIVFYVGWSPNNEGLVSRPSSSEKSQMITEMLNNKLLFVYGTLQDAKAKLSWLDAITYEEARKLARAGKFNAQNLNEILS